MPRWVPKFTKHPSFTSSRCVLGGRAKKETSNGTSGQSSWHKTSNQNRTGHFPPPNQTSNKNKKQNNTWQDAWPKYNALVIILPISVCLCVSVHDDENKQGTKQARALPSHVVELVWTDVALPRSLSSLSLSPISLSHTLASHTTRFDAMSTPRYGCLKTNCRWNWASKRAKWSWSMATWTRTASTWARWMECAAWCPLTSWPSRRPRIPQRGASAGDRPTIETVGWAAQAEEQWAVEWMRQVLGLEGPRRPIGTAWVVEWVAPINGLSPAFEKVCGLWNVVVVSISRHQTHSFLSEFKIYIKYSLLN